MEIWQINLRGRKVKTTRNFLLEKSLAMKQKIPSQETFVSDSRMRNERIS